MIRMYFKHVYVSLSEWKPMQFFDDGRSRFVDPEYAHYIDWIKEHDPEVVPWSPSWDVIRNERDRLLKDSDWTQLADAPLSETSIAAWKVYRQTLRDIPQEYPTPDDVQWPEIPQ